MFMVITRYNIVHSLVLLSPNQYAIYCAGRFVLTLNWEPAAFFYRSDVDPAD